MNQKPYLSYNVIDRKTILMSKSRSESVQKIKQAFRKFKNNQKQKSPISQYRRVISPEMLTSPISVFIILTAIMILSLIRPVKSYNSEVLISATTTSVTPDVVIKGSRCKNGYVAITAKHIMGSYSKPAITPGAAGKADKNQVETFKDLDCWEENENCVACGKKGCELWATSATATNKLEFKMKFFYKHLNSSIADVHFVKVIENTVYFLQVEKLNIGVLRWSALTEKKYTVFKDFPGWSNTLAEATAPAPTAFEVVQQTKFAMASYTGKKKITTFDYLQMNKINDYTTTCDPTAMVYINA